MGDNHWKRWLIPHDAYGPKRGTFGPLASGIGLRCGLASLREGKAHQGDDP